MRYKLGVMSHSMYIDADTPEDAVAVALLFYGANLPIAIYEPAGTKCGIKFPYVAKDIEMILESMGEEKIRKIYNSITIL